MPGSGRRHCGPEGWAWLGAGSAWEALRHLSPPWQMEEFQIYEKYCQNKPRSESLWRQCSDCPFFQVRSRPAQFHPLYYREERGCLTQGLVVTGMPEEAGPQAEPGLLPAEASPEDHQVPAATQGDPWRPPAAPERHSLRASLAPRLQVPGSSQTPVQGLLCASHCWGPGTQR